MNANYAQQQNSRAGQTGGSLANRIAHHDNRGGARSARGLGYVFEHAGLYNANNNAAFDAWLLEDGGAEAEVSEVTNDY